MPLGKIAEARAAQEEAVTHLEHDMKCVIEGMVGAGVDGIDFDTAGASGDADLLATLRVARWVRDTYPDIGVEIGQAWSRSRHARRTSTTARGWPASGRSASSACRSRRRHDLRATVNVNTTKSLAWNTARACALIKPVTAAATIPVHVNAGMGVGGVPDPIPARRRDVPGVQGARRHLQDRRVAGRRRRSPWDRLITRARLGHGPDAAAGESGGPHPR